MRWQQHNVQFQKASAGQSTSVSWYKDAVHFNGRIRVVFADFGAFRKRLDILGKLLFYLIEAAACLLFRTTPTQAKTTDWLAKNGDSHFGWSQEHFSKMELMYNDFLDTSKFPDKLFTVPRYWEDLPDDRFNTAWPLAQTFDTWEWTVAEGQIITKIWQDWIDTSYGGKVPNKGVEVLLEIWERSSLALEKWGSKQKPSELRPIRSRRA